MLRATPAVLPSRDSPAPLLCLLLSLSLIWGPLSPQYDYLGDRRPVPAGVYPYHFPASPTIHDKMVRTRCPLGVTDPTLGTWGRLGGPHSGGISALQGQSQSWAFHGVSGPRIRVGTPLCITLRPPGRSLAEGGAPQTSPALLPHIWPQLLGSRASCPLPELGGTPGGPRRSQNPGMGAPEEGET